MKKIYLYVTLVLLVCLLAGCGNNAVGTSGSRDDGNSNNNYAQEDNQGEKNEQNKEDVGHRDPSMLTDAIEEDPEPSIDPGNQMGEDEIPSTSSYYNGQFFDLGKYCEACGARLWFTDGNPGTFMICVTFKNDCSIYFYDTKMMEDFKTLTPSNSGVSSIAVVADPNEHIYYLSGTYDDFYRIGNQNTKIETYLPKDTIEHLPYIMSQAMSAGSSGKINLDDISIDYVP